MSRRDPSLQAAKLAGTQKLCVLMDRGFSKETTTEAFSPAERRDRESTRDTFREIFNATSPTCSRNYSEDLIIVLVVLTPLQDPGDPETHWHRDDEAVGLPNLHEGL